jgi:four helix bundle protein
MNDFKDHMKGRTKAAAVEILQICDALPKSISATAIIRQLTRSGTAIGANYRASCRAKSRADFISKMQTVEIKNQSVLICAE